MGIKFPTPWKTLIIKFPPPRNGKGVKFSGYAWGGGGGCWSFDLTDTLDSHMNTLLFLTHLPTCQDGVENLDKVYFANHRQRDYKWFKIRSNTIDKRATIRDITIAKLSLASLLLRAPQCWCNHSFSLHSLSSVIIIHMSLVALNKYDWQNFIQQGITRKVKK